MNLVTEAAERLRRRRAELLAKYEANQVAQQAKPSKAKLDYSGCLKKWWSGMAPAVRQRPWDMNTIMASAFPALKPAPRYVAAALRDLGFTEKRAWTRAGRNRRYWLAPAN
jgi:hypothetical protein